MGRLVGLDDAEGVYIEAKGDRRALAAAEYADNAGMAALCIGQELGVSALGDGPFILGVKDLGIGQPHAGVIEADVASDKDLKAAHIGQASCDDRG